MFPENLVQAAFQQVGDFRVVCNNLQNETGEVIWFTFITCFAVIQAIEQLVLRALFRAQQWKYSVDPGILTNDFQVTDTAS